MASVFFEGPPVVVNPGPADMQHHPNPDAARKSGN